MSAREYMLHSAQLVDAHEKLTGAEEVSKQMNRIRVRTYSIVSFPPIFLDSAMYRVINVDEIGAMAGETEFLITVFKTLSC